jgi:hypothetical protein
MLVKKIKQPGEIALHFKDMYNSTNTKISRFTVPEMFVEVKEVAKIHASQAKSTNTYADKNLVLLQSITVDEEDVRNKHKRNISLLTVDTKKTGQLNTPNNNKRVKVESRDWVNTNAGKQGKGNYGLNRDKGRGNSWDHRENRVGRGSFNDRYRNDGRNNNVRNFQEWKKNDTGKGNNFRDINRSKDDDLYKDLCKGCWHHLGHWKHECPFQREPGWGNAEHRPLSLSGHQLELARQRGKK